MEKPELMYVQVIEPQPAPRMKAPAMVWPFRATPSPISPEHVVQIRDMMTRVRAGDLDIEDVCEAFGVSEKSANDIANAG